MNQQVKTIISEKEVFSNAKTGNEADARKMKSHLEGSVELTSSENIIDQTFCKWKYNKDRTVRHRKGMYGTITEFKPFDDDLKYSMELPKLLK